MRGTGKTYTSLTYFVNKAINKGSPFIYLVRKQKQLQRKGTIKALNKVLQQQFGDIQFYERSHTVYIKNTDQVICTGLSLSDAYDSKILSFPGYESLIFDEYIAELHATHKYINGYNEPDIFLNLYHTIDRGQNKLKCYFFGNNVTFYNPYHVHPAFNIPPSSKGSIWYNKNTLYYWSDAKPYYNDDSILSKKILNTTYGKYALKGEYAETINHEIVAHRPPQSRVLCNIKIAGDHFTIWSYTCYCYVTEYNNNNAITYTDTIKPIGGRYMSIYTADHVRQWLKKLLYSNCLYFDDPSVYIRFFDHIKVLL